VVETRHRHFMKFLKMFTTFFRIPFNGRYRQVWLYIYITNCLMSKFRNTSVLGGYCICFKFCLKYQGTNYFIVFWFINLWKKQIYKRLWYLLPKSRKMKPPSSGILSASTFNPFVWKTNAWIELSCFWKLLNYEVLVPSIYFCQHSF
jgi:hypothetical protein